MKYSAVMVAIHDGDIVGALDPTVYKGIEHPFPHGWDTLTKQLGHSNYDVVDIDCQPELAQSIIHKHVPTGTQAYQPGTLNNSLDNNSD